MHQHLRRRSITIIRVGGVGVDDRAADGVHIAAVEVASVDSVLRTPRLRVQGADLALYVAVLHQEVAGKELAGGGSTAIGRGVGDIVGALSRASCSTTLNGEGLAVVVCLVAHVGVDTVDVVGGCVDSGVSEVAGYVIAGD